MTWNKLYILFFIMIGSTAFGQQAAGLDSAIAKLTKEKDPQRSVAMTDSIVRLYKLDPNEDAEKLDMLYGTVAVNFAMARNYSRFEKYIGLIRNKFNQTSFMNMAASKMLDENLDARRAKMIAEKTLFLYNSFKNDSTARPPDFPPNDWKRFMHFAQFPYNDTYAHALFALKDYKPALRYQELAFEGSPEEGLPASVERYAKLLQLTGKTEQACQLLLHMARLGKINKGMTEQLRSIYIAGNGSDAGLGALLDSLQKNVRAALMAKLKPGMLHEAAPGFSLKDMQGKNIRLSDFKGKIVVLDLWATWCKPCIASFPAMQRMVEKHPDIVFLFIDVEEGLKDPLPKVKTFIEKHGYSFTVLLDEPLAPNDSRYKIITAYAPNGIPAKYIIDGNGILRFKTTGFDTDAELVNELEAMFALLKSL
jgi:thiol-disulfide isomerase/thioredoxin